jgi:hypothetical protein
MVVWLVSLNVLAVEFLVFEIGFLNVGLAFSLGRLLLGLPSLRVVLCLG